LFAVCLSLNLSVVPFEDIHGHSLRWYRPSSVSPTV
jgi:hypothetical protein